MRSFCPVKCNDFCKDFCKYHSTLPNGGSGAILMPEPLALPVFSGCHRFSGNGSRSFAFIRRSNDAKGLRHIPHSGRGLPWSR